MFLRLLGKFWLSREADIAVVPEWRERGEKHVLLASLVGWERSRGEGRRASVWREVRLASNRSVQFADATQER